MSKVRLSLGLVLWITLVALLPVTSMPYIVRLVKSSTVAAPAGLALLVIIILCFIPALVRGIILPRTSYPLLIFAVFAVVVTLTSNFCDIPSYKGFQPLRSQFEALLTLAIGIAFFLVPAHYLRNKAWMQITLRVINWSGLVVILWCAVQAFFWYSQQSYPQWLRTIQEFFSVGPLYRQRVTGFTLEPSWLAHQLNMLYLPIWLAASTVGYSSHRRFVDKVSFENLLLIGGAATLFLTLSRVGLMAFLLMLAYLAIRIGIGLNQLLRRKLSSRLGAFDQLNQQHPILAVAALSGGMAIVGLVLLVLFIAFMSQFDPRMGEMFNFNLASETPLLDYANALTFSSRLVYWQAGWAIFNDNIWFGVGLGNSGFYIPQVLSGYADRLVEVQALLYHSHTLLNIKSLWVRLLAETGIIGFSIFTAWLISLWSAARRLASTTLKLNSMMSLFGLFMLLGILVEGFSIDSFALPYIWFSFGMVTAVQDES